MALRSFVSMRFALACVLSCFLVCSMARPARATPLRPSAQDRAQVERLVRAFFDAVRDGNAAQTALLVPTEAEFRALFTPGTQMFIERHRRSLERDTRDLRSRFAGGTFVGLSGAFAGASAVEVAQCGRFAVPSSRCADGPVIEFRVGAETRRMRIDRLVRIGNRWKIFDARL